VKNGEQSLKALAHAKEALSMTTLAIINAKLDIAKLKLAMLELEETRIVTKATRAPSKAANVAVQVPVTDAMPGWMTNAYRGERGGLLTYSRPRGFGNFKKGKLAYASALTGLSSVCVCHGLARLVVAGERTPKNEAFYEVHPKNS
jgi:hypothetical protein